MQLLDARRARVVSDLLSQRMLEGVGARAVARRWRNSRSARCWMCASSEPGPRQTSCRSTGGNSRPRTAAAHHAPGVVRQPLIRARRISRRRELRTAPPQAVPCGPTYLFEESGFPPPCPGSCPPWTRTSQQESADDGALSPDERCRERSTAKDPSIQGGRYPGRYVDRN